MSVNASNDQKPSVIEVFMTFLRLGFTSFGGPVAHLGYFHIPSHNLSAVV